MRSLADPLPINTADKIEYARLLKAQGPRPKAQGPSLGAIATKTGVPKTSLHRAEDRKAIAGLERVPALARI